MPNPSGRPKGSKNSSKKALINLLQMQYPNYEPVLEMAHIAMNEENDLSLRASMHKEVAAYCYPKLKAMEVNIEADIRHSYYVSGTPIKEIDGKVIEVDPEQWAAKHIPKPA